MGEVDSSEPVAFVVTRYVKPGDRSKYQAWLEEVGASVRELDPGFRMTVIEQGGPQADEYVLVLYFSNHQKLDEWLESSTREKLRGEADLWSQGKASFREVTGFEYWFSLPKVAAIRPPARYKMAIITMLGIYILSMATYLAVEEWLVLVHWHIGVFIRIFITVMLMTFLVMPLLTRLFARWLYPAHSRKPSKKR